MSAEARTTDAARPAPPRNRLVQALWSAIAAGAVVLILLTLGGFFARYSWRLEQLCHFRVQYFWLLAAAAVVLFVAQRRLLGLAGFAAAIVNGALIAPIYVPADQPAPDGSSLRLLSYNVLGRNERHDEVLAYLRRESADLVLLMEVQPHWAEKLELLRDLYPYQHLLPRRDNFGIALLSKTEWREVQTIELGSSEVPTIVATLVTDERPWIFIGTHPVPPGSAIAAAARNEQLALIAEYVQRQSLPVVAAGDLNVTSFSPYFQDFLSATDLRDSRQGFGVQASWSPRLPVLEIPIDHCLVPPEFHVADRRVGPRMGSDHRPVIIDVQWAKSAAR
jgi:endonuclease/exonuclease/phosphatase (EEP) superfamily protein YafD